MPITFLQTVSQYALSILPWVLIGIGIAYFLEKHLNPNMIHKYLGSFGNKTILSSIGLGMISPLSILSFLPVAKEFINMGAHPGILYGFLIAERTYDFQSFFIISSLFGVKFAILNALAIFISLYISIMILKDEPINFKIDMEAVKNHFWKRQLKLLSIVTIGIILSAFFRTYMPADIFRHTTGSPLGGMAGGLLSGFVLYLGPIIANYPIAKAFLDLGMSHAGVFTFLTISPVINIVIISIFGGTVGYRVTLKSFLIYTQVALILTLLFIPIL